VQAEVSAFILNLFIAKSDAYVTSPYNDGVQSNRKIWRI